jgi:flavin-dependent dehydrogenase
MNRYAFDRWLLSLVPDNVNIMQTRCEDIIRTDGGFSLTLTDGIITADTVIGADGGGSIVRRKLIGRMPAQYLSIQEHYRDLGQCVPPYACIFDAATSDSCSWTIRKDGTLIFGGAFAKHGAREAFAAQKARLEAHLGCRFGEPARREACLVTSPRRLNDFHCGKSGAFLLGEAAGFISASSFEGISSAITSAKLLAEAFAESCDTAAILQSYRRKSQSLRLKLYAKTFKRQILCTPASRYAIMASGVQSLDVADRKTALHMEKAPRLLS